MAQSGWYDDPDGTVGRLRYWDGTQWSQDTMPKPDAAAPAASASSDVPSAPRPDQTAVLPTVNPSSPYGGGYTQPQPPYGQGSASSTQGPASYGPGAAYGPGSAYAGGGYPQQPAPPYGPATPTRSPGPRRRGVSPMLALGLLALLVGLGFGASSLLRTLQPTSPTTAGTRTGAPTLMPTAFPTITSKPTVTVPGATAVPTIPAEDPSSMPTIADCVKPAPGTLTDGTITVTMPSTWGAQLAPVAWSDCYSVGGREITSGWLTSAIVGNGAADGLTAQQAAQEVWAWNTATNYQSVTSDKVAKEEAVTIGGRKGYKLSGQVKISGLAGVAGDDVTVLVLDDADGSHSVLVTASTIGDAQSRSEVDSIWASLKVA